MVPSCSFPLSNIHERSDLALKTRCQIPPLMYDAWVGAAQSPQYSPRRRRAPMRTRNGFTLAETLIVLVIIAILAALAIPNFIDIQNRANDGRTKANMHEVQLACEDYAQQNDGLYTSNPTLIKPLLWRYLKNPFTGKGLTLMWDPSDVCAYPKGTIVLSPNSARVTDGMIDVRAGYMVRGVGHDGKYLALVLKDGQ